MRRADPFTARGALLYFAVGLVVGTVVSVTAFFVSRAL